MSENAISGQEIANREHISPNKTGDNIAAKKVVPYSWDGSNWQRFSVPFNLPAYDYVSLSSYDANNNPGTITYKLGGSGGTTVATLTLSYSGTNITSIARS